MTKRLTLRLLPLIAVLLTSQSAMGQFATERKDIQRAPASSTRVRSVPLDTTIHPMLNKGHYTFAAIIDGDTIPLYYMKEVKVYADGMLLTPKEIQQNRKLIRNVKLMRPYALEGKRRLDELEVQIAALPRKERRKAIKEAEAELLRDYKGELSNYTFSQGLVLIKLIDRETNRTAYNIVGELRGSLRAGLYQTLAKLFGYNLKDTFDPKHNKKDDLIDRICLSIDREQL
ncbi:MAG: DUF4294 domain-containing protein [Bacteroidales bacterium]|nr:DUF4294 domain-containing protein [Bacteroidales bacterium]